MNTDYVSNRYTNWYSEYKRFFNNYNQYIIGEPCRSYLDFMNIAPMYIFDVQRKS